MYFNEATPLCHLLDEVVAYFTFRFKIKLLKYGEISIFNFNIDMP